MYQLGQILRNEDNAEKIQRMEAFLLQMAKPKSFEGKTSQEIIYEKNFLEICIFIQSELGVQTDKISTLEFYNAFEYIKKKNKSKPGSNGKPNKV